MSAKQTLAMMRPGSRAVILDFTTTGNDGFIKRVMEMGMTRGTEIELAHTAPFGGAIAVRCRTTMIALRIEDAERIEVRVL